MPDLEYMLPSVRRRIIKVTLSNTQSVATANPHIQKIKISHYDLLRIINADLSPYTIPFNTVFYDPQASAQAYSWYEQYDETYHYWWVKTNSIGANSTYTLYMVIDLTSQLIDGKYAGISAIYGQNYLNLSYGQYDNGDNVFLFYDNFQGTSINTNKWYVGGSDNDISYTTITANNGLTITSQYKEPTGTYGGIVSVNSYPANTIFEAYLGSFSVINSSYNSSHGIGVQPGSASATWGYAYTSYNGSNPNGGTLSEASISGGTSDIAAGPNFPKSNAILSIFWPATGYEGTCVNDNCVYATDNWPTNTGSINCAIAAYFDSQGATSTWYYARLRDYPPNGVMPTTSFSLVD